MSIQTDVREFLVSRRAKVTPEQAGLPAYGGKRRVPGLRREEVALLAGVSVDYYNRLERGNLHGVSDSVLDAVARALQLDEAEHEHLFDLARAANDTRARPVRTPKPKVRPSVQRLLDAITDGPAQVRNGRMDVLAANAIGVALFSEAYEDPRRPMNSTRYLFLDPRARYFYDNWEKAASDSVAILRTELGRAPHDKDLMNLVGELSTRSDEFRVRWARHDVRLHYTGVKVFHHPVVGDLEVGYEALGLSADPGLTLTVYTAVKPSDSEKFRLLASWHATQQELTENSLFQPQTREVP